MPLLRCTEKLFKAMKTTPGSEQVEIAQFALGDWYANLLRIIRKQCVIFMNERTLFSLLAYAPD